MTVELPHRARVVSENGQWLRLELVGLVSPRWCAWWAIDRQKVHEPCAGSGLEQARTHV